MLKAGKNEEGEYVFQDTDDELIDKWERELSMGITPDLTEGMSKDRLDDLKKDSQKAQRAKEQIKELDNIGRTLKQAYKKDPMYKPVSAEELKGKILGG